jgi:hypothetical protein
VLLEINDVIIQKALRFGGDEEASDYSTLHKLLKQLCNFKYSDKEIYVLILAIKLVNFVLNEVVRVRNLSPEAQPMIDVKWLSK